MKPTIHLEMILKSRNNELSKRQLNSSKMLRFDRQVIHIPLNKFQSVDNYLEYLTPSLKSQLKTMFVSKDSDKKIAFIGQAIMQQIQRLMLLVSTCYAYFTRSRYGWEPNISIH